MDDLCTACLCAGRKLFFIGETGSYHLYSQILNEIPVYDFSEVCVRVCWECRALLRRFREFKSLVKKSYGELLQQLHQNDPPSRWCLAKPSRLQQQALTSYEWPEDDVKQEPCDGDTESKPLKEEPIHSEPDAEALEEKVEVKKTKKKKTVKKTAKEKTTKAKTKKKVKSKSTKKKLEEKKINTKKRREDAHSVSSEDSRLFNDAAVDDDAEVDDNPVIEEEKEVEDSVATANNKAEEEFNEEDDIPLIDKRPESTPLKAQVSLRKSKADEAELGEKPTCVECGKVFSSKKTYRYHLNVLHKGQNRYPCSRCGKVYQWKSNLGRHMRTHKARDAGELHCVPCDKRFASVATYRQHLRASRRHAPEATWRHVCSHCGRRFVSRTRLRDHVDWEHLNNVKFRCQICNKPFKCHTSLYVHMQNVHRNKKKENLCHICGKSYQNAAKLKYHIVAMHTSETPYQCGQCAAAFGWYSSLYRHVREVHYKMKLQPKKIRKSKRPSEPLPPPPPLECPPHPAPLLYPLPNTLKELL